MKKWIVVTAILAAIPSTALADNGAPNVLLGGNLGFQDAHVAVPYTGGGTPSFQGVEGGSVLNIGATYRNSLGASGNWQFTAGGDFGLLSGWKYEDDTGEFSGRLKGWGVRAGLEYLQPVGDRVSIYGGGRLFYSSMTGEYEDDTDTVEGEPFNVFGFEPAIGCLHRMSDAYSFFGEFYNQFGIGSTEVGSEKYSEWVKYGCWRGGVLFHL